MYKFLIMNGMLLAATYTSAQGANAVSLEDAKIYALEHHYTVKNGVNDIEIARQQIVETRGMGLPQVSMQGTFNHFINLPVTVMEAKFLNPMAPDGETVSFTAGTKFNSTGTFQVNQLLFNGSYIIGLQAARFFANFQESVAEQSQETVVFNVIQAYELAAVAKQNKAFMDSLVSASEKLVEDQSNFLELGLILQEDMDQLMYSLLSAKSALTAADVQYQNALSMLKLSMGYPIGDPIELTNTPDDLIVKNAISTGDIHENLTYQIMEKQVKLSEYNVKNNQMANVPSLNAFFQQSYNAYRNEFDFFADEKWYPQTLWGLQLDIPIFSGLSRHARTSQARVKMLKDQNSLSQMEQTLQFQEVQLRNNLNGAQNKLDLQRENVALAESIYTNAVTKKSIGKGTSILVTQKHTQLMTAQAQYVGAMVDLFQTKLELDKLYNNILPNNK